MVRIPERPYSHISGARRIAPQGTAPPALWGSLAAVGDSIVTTVEAYRARRQHDLFAEGQNDYARSVQPKQNEDTPEQQGAKAEGFARRFIDRHREAVEGALSRMREAGAGEATLRAFDIWAREREQKGFLKAAQYEHDQMRTHARQVHAERIQQISRGLESDPLLFDDALQQAGESYAIAVGQGIYTAQEAKERFARMRGTLQETAFTRLYAQDPEKAMERLEAFGFQGERKATLKKQYEADLAARKTVEKSARDDAAAALYLQFEEAESNALRAGDGTVFQTLAENLSSMGQKEAAHEARNRAALFERHASLIKESGSIPLPALLEKIEKDMQAGGLDAESPLGRPPDRMEQLHLRRKIYVERRRTLTADPAGAVEREVAAALELDAPQEEPLQTLAADPAGNLERLADLRVLAQLRNGLAETDCRRMTNAETLEFQETWRAGDARIRLESALSLLKYGKHAGAVAVELGLRPAEHLVLLQVRSDPRASLALASVIEANAALQSSPLERNRGDDAARELREACQVFQVADAAMRALPATPSLKARRENYARTLERLAAMEGGDIFAAAKLLDGRLKALVSGDCCVCFDPAEHGDAAILERTLHAIQFGVITDAHQQASAGSPVGPAGERNARPGTGQRNAVWVNAPDGDGFALMEPGGHWLLRIRNGQLRQMAVAWPA